MFSKQLLLLKSYGHQFKIQETCGLEIQRTGSGLGSAGLVGGLPPLASAIVDFLRFKLSKLTFFFFILKRF